MENFKKLMSKNSEKELKNFIFYHLIINENLSYY